MENPEQFRRSGNQAAPEATDAAAGVSRARFCVIANAGSGRGAATGDNPDLEQALTAFSGSFDLVVVEPGQGVEQAARTALDRGYEAVVAAGGDGTICGVAAILAGTGVPMGVVPMGTFNYFARSLGLPQNAAEALRVVVEGRPQPVRSATVNDRLFLNNASLGAYASILETRERVYQRWGRSRLAAYWSVLVTLVHFRRPLSMRLTVDGQERNCRTPLAFVVNNAYQLEQMGLEGADCIGAGKFVLLVAPDCGRMGLLRRAFSLANHSLEPDRDFELLCGREITIATRRIRRLVARDGERDILRNPFTFRLHEDALLVVLPVGAQSTGEVR